MHRIGADTLSEGYRACRLNSRARNARDGLLKPRPHNVISAPRLSIEHLADGHVRLSWPSPATDFVLDSTTTLAAPTTNSWSKVPFPYETNASHISITTTQHGSKFYRLRKP